MMSPNNSSPLVRVFSQMMPRHAGSFIHDTGAAESEAPMTSMIVPSFLPDSFIWSLLTSDDLPGMSTGTCSTSAENSENAFP